MTLLGAIRAFILADATLAAKVSTSVYPVVLPENPPANACVIKFPSGMVSWSTLQGATSMVNARIEVTFWCEAYLDGNHLALRLLEIIRAYNGSMSGVTIAVFQTLGPRDLYHPESKRYGSQVDIMATVDLNTVA